MDLPSHAQLLSEHIGGMSYTELGVKYNVSPNVIKGRVRTASVRARTGQRVEPKPELFKVDIGKPLSLTGDFIIVGDVHVPTTDYEFVALPAAVGKKQLRHPRLIIGGDLFNMDVFSKYPALTTRPTWKDERLAAKQLINEWLEVFEHIYILVGNHERRTAKFTHESLTSTDLVEMAVSDLERVTISNYGWCTVQTEKEPWRITHQEDYSKNQLNVAGELALKYQSNIISFHQHHLALGYDKYKHYIAIDGGGLFDDKQMAYVQLDDSTKANMQKGFVMLKDGYPYLFGDERLTDYSRWI